MYTESNIPRIFGIASLGKKLVFHTEICQFSDQRILKIDLCHRIKELFKVNQIDIPDYQYYLGCNAKRMVRLAFLEKNIVFHSEIST